jgi:hypothetical protein
VKQGLQTPDETRSVVVSDGLADTGATPLWSQTALINRLGLSKVSFTQVRSSSGISEADLCDAVRLTVGARSCTMDVQPTAESMFTSCIEGRKLAKSMIHPFITHPPMRPSACLFTSRFYLPTA